MTKNKIKKAIFGISLTLLLSLSGCGQKVLEAPGLIEPKARNEAYRTVTKNDVGNMKLVYGVVTPMEYAHFWTGIAKIQEIHVKVGDYVEKGQVLATADMEAATEELNALQQSLSLEQNILEKTNAIYEAKKAQINLKIADCRLQNDTETEESLTTELAILEENNRFDNLLSGHRVSDINDAIAKQQKLLSDGTLVARESGYVTYIRDLSMSTNVSEKDNICVIADYDNCYVELPVTLKDNYPKIYPKAYACQNGNKYELSYWDYEPNEKLVTTSQNAYPNERMRYVIEENMPEAGSQIPILFYGKLVENVTVVGLDSVLSDSDGEYVYVKSNQGHEKRYIETGAKDLRNVEVISGVEVGEQVEYTSDALVPQEYDIFTVAMADYSPSLDMKGFTMEDSKTIQTISEWEGTICSIGKTEGSSVLKGDLICTLQTNAGGAALTEMRNNITSYETSFSEENKAYEDQKKAMEEQRASILLAKEALLNPPLDETISDTATQTDATGDETMDIEDAVSLPVETSVALLQNQYDELGYELQQLTLFHDIATLQYNYTHANMEKEYADASKNNNGKGLIYIYADCDGTIKNSGIHEGKTIKTGDRLFNIEASGENQIVLRTDATLCLGAKVLFAEQGGTNISGAVCGYSGYGMNKHYYVTTIQDKVYVTESLSANGSTRYIVGDFNERGNMENDLDENKKYTISSSAGSVSDVVLLPGNMVYTEKSEVSSDQNKYYVWKIENDNLEKFYIDMERVTVDGSSYCLCLSGLHEGDKLAQEKEAVNQ